MAKKLIKTLFKESDIKTAHFDTYKINNSPSNISMNVFPGDNGQKFFTEAYLENEKILSNKEESIQNFVIGKNSALKGKSLDVYTIVTDVLGVPDLTSFRFQLKGGVIPYEYFVEKTVQAQGDSVVYKISIFFSIH